MEITELVSQDVVTVYLDDTLLEVAEVLREEKVGSVVVLDSNGDPLGIVTDRDLVVYGETFADDLEQTTVNQILAMGIASVEPDASLDELTTLMREESVRRIPVLDDGELVGIVTLDDVVAHLADHLDSPELEDVAAVIESESPPRNAGDPA